MVTFPAARSIAERAAAVRRRALPVPSRLVVYDAASASSACTLARTFTGTL